MKLIVKYNGNRYPRTVNLRGGLKTAFVNGRDVIEINEYDALLLLTYNHRLMPDKWEFTIVGVVGESGLGSSNKTQQDIVKELDNTIVDMVNAIPTKKSTKKRGK